MNVPDDRIKTLVMSGFYFEESDEEYIKRKVAYQMGEELAAKLLEFNKVKFKDGMYWASLSIIVPETPK